MKMLNNHLLCKIVKPENNSIIIDTTKKQYKVVEICQGAEEGDNKTSVKNGDIAYIHRRAGFDVEVNGEQRYIISKVDIILIL